MTAFASSDIRELRSSLGWSAQEMGEFFNRTGVTIYHWESGKTSPGSNMRALLKALDQELSWHTQEYSEEELQQWTEQLLERGIEALLCKTTRSFTVEEEPASFQHMLERACRHGGLTIRSASGEVLAYLVPNSIPELVRWAHTLLEVTIREDDASEAGSNVPANISRREVSLSIQ